MLLRRRRLSKLTPLCGSRRERERERERLIDDLSGTKRTRKQNLVSQSQKEASNDTEKLQNKKQKLYAPREEVERFSKTQKRVHRSPRNDAHAATERSKARTRRSQKERFYEREAAATGRGGEERSKKKIFYTTLHLSKDNEHDSLEFPIKRSTPPQSGATNHLHGDRRSR
jgi:hypothetical protein